MALTDAELSAERFRAMDSDMVVVQEGKKRTILIGGEPLPFFTSGPLSVGELPHAHGNHVVVNVPIVVRSCSHVVPEAQPADSEG